MKKTDFRQKIIKKINELRTKKIEIRQINKSNIRKINSSSSRLTLFEGITQIICLLLPVKKARDSTANDFIDDSTDSGIETHFLSESALSKDWLSEDEDQAWQDL